MKPALSFLRHKGLTSAWSFGVCCEQGGRGISLSLILHCVTGNMLHASLCQLISSFPTGPSLSKISIPVYEVGQQTTEKAGTVPSWQR